MKSAQRGCHIAAQCLLASALIGAYPAHAAPPTQNEKKTVQAERAPDAVVVDFYKWYVHEFELDHYPIDSDRAKMRSYVTAALIKAVRNGAEPDADYFTKSQDVPEAWGNSIAVAGSKINGNTASVTITLGTSKEMFRKLTAALIKEGRDWKIRSIHDDTVYEK